MANKNIAYIRASTSAQAVSPVRQRKLIEEWASKNNKKIAEWYQEEPITGSASIKDRPELTAALMAVGKGDNLVVLDITRLARSQLVFNMVLGMLHTKKANLMFADGTSYEEDCLYSRLMMSVMSFASEWEKQQISMRTKTALAVIGKTKALGRPDRCKYGWSNKDGMLVANDKEQEVGMFVKECRSKGMTYKRIEKALVDKGYYNRSGKPFSNAAVQHMYKTFRVAT